VGERLKYVRNVVECHVVDLPFGNGRNGVHEARAGGAPDELLGGAGSGDDLAAPVEHGAVPAVGDPLVLDQFLESFGSDGDRQDIGDPVLDHDRKIEGCYGEPGCRPDVQIGQVRCAGFLNAPQGLQSNAVRQRRSIRHAGVEQRPAARLEQGDPRWFCERGFQGLPVECREITVLDMRRLRKNPHADLDFLDLAIERQGEGAGRFLQAKIGGPLLGLVNRVETATGDQNSRESQNKNQRP
jgi:hypothetical protein